jgi:hypothetical protein
MAVRQKSESASSSARECSRVGDAVHMAVGRGLVVGRQVKLGVVRGIVIGYNIARVGRYPGTRYPLLVKTELGIAKCCLDEVVPV